MTIPVQLNDGEHIVLLVALIAEIRTGLQYRKHESARARIRSAIALHRKLTLAGCNASRRAYGLAPYRTFNDMRAAMESFRQRRAAAQSLALAA
jgi:hypothetical protein